MKKHIVPLSVSLVIFNIIIAAFLLFYGNQFYVIAGDTIGYQIYSLNEISWIHRTPGYQIISFIFFAICGKDYSIADYYIVIFQFFFLIVGDVFFFFALYEYSKDIILSSLISYYFSLIVLVFGFGSALLTESYAIAIMCLQIYCIVKFVNNPKPNLSIISVILGFLGMIIRPSHIIVLFVLFGFYIIFLFLGEKKSASAGLISLVIVGIVILVYCIHNKIAFGYFGISDVKPYNDLATILNANAFDNPLFSNITEYIENNMADEQSNWSISKNVFKEFGFRNTINYIKSCKINNLSLYWKYIFIDFYNTSKNVVLFDYLRNYNNISIIAFINKYLFPFKFGFVWVVSFLSLLISLCAWIFKKKPLWIEMGISILILAIHFSSRYSCHTDTLVRTGIHAVPSIFFLMIIVLLWIKKIFIYMQKKKHNKRRML